MVHALGPAEDVLTVAIRGQLGGAWWTVSFGRNSESAKRSNTTDVDRTSTSKETHNLKSMDCLCHIPQSIDPLGTLSMSWLQPYSMRRTSITCDWFRDGFKSSPASKVDWGFRSTPQEHLLPRGRVIDLERGKTLGGSSAINYNMSLGSATVQVIRVMDSHRTTWLGENPETMLKMINIRSRHLSTKLFGTLNEYIFPQWYPQTTQD